MFRIKSQSKSGLGFEITIAVLIKLSAIFLIWHYFFSHPVENELTPSKIKQHLLGAQSQP